MQDIQTKTSSTCHSILSNNNKEGTPTLEINSQLGSKYLKVSPLPKPDFSSIEKKESNFVYKQKGSYKKPKSIVPESPMKSPNQRVFTPVKFNMENNNLVGISNQSTCRKLTFAEQIAEEENPRKSPHEETEFIESFKQNNRTKLIDGCEEESNTDMEIHSTNKNTFLNFMEMNSMGNTNHNNLNIDFISNCDKIKLNKFQSSNSSNFVTSLFCEEESDQDFNLYTNVKKNKYGMFENREISSLKDLINDKNDEIHENNKFSLKFGKNSLMDIEFESKNKKGELDNNFQIKYPNQLNEQTNINDFYIDYKDKLIKNDSESFIDINEINNQSKLADSKFEQKFFVIKAIEAGAFGIVYKCLNKIDNQIYAVKKSKRHSSHSDFNNIQNLINDFNSNKDDIFSVFCVNSKESWLEREFHEHTLTDDHLYISQDFCPFGDLLNYLEKLEKVNSIDTPILNENFYWDLIFEMMCGIHFLHKCGYVHLDVKPGNFLITENGGVKIGDFGLTKKISDIKLGEDLNEGDSSYLAPEFFGEAKKKFLINSKCDVFSLGLSIMEIVCKIEIPQNGVLWEEIRGKNFDMPSEFLNNSNIKIGEKMVKLIMNMMIIDPIARPDIIEIFENDYFDEISKRYKALVTGCYIRSFNPVEIINSEKLVEMEVDTDGVVKFFHAKRSNSYKLFDELI